VCSDLRCEELDIVVALPADVQDGDTNSREHLVDERVAPTAVGAEVRGVVELDHQARGVGNRIDQDEVQALGLDALPVRRVAAGTRLNLNEAGQALLVSFMARSRRRRSARSRGVAYLRRSKRLSISF
jgi:hypothetical protein